MDRHISSSNFQISNIGFIRRFLTIGICKTMVNAAITARPDYGNCPHLELQSIPSKEYNFSKTLQLVLLLEHRNGSISPLSWQLSIGYLCTFVRGSKYWHMSINRSTGKLHHIQYKLQYKPTISLQSESTSRLVTPKIRTKISVERELSCVAAHLWNALPGDIKKAQSLNTFKDI